MPDDEKKTYRDDKFGDTYEEHPSYGVVGFSRMSVGSSGLKDAPKDSGYCKLFGSPLRHHPQVVRLTIKRATLAHGLSYDRFHGKEIIAVVDLSPSQFVDLITSLNVGDGVPCTLRYVNEEGEISNPPIDDKVEVERISDGFKANMNELVAGFDKLGDEADAILSKKGAINKADRERLAELSRQMRQFFASNAPFVVNQFGEASERVVDSAKREVVAYTDAVVRATGLEALRGIAGGAGIPELPEHEEEE